MKKNKIALIITGGTIVGSLLLSNAALAYTPMSGGKRHAITDNDKNLPNIMPMHPAIVGEVAGRDGNIIYIRDKTGTVHTVDAEKATITMTNGEKTETVSLPNVDIGHVVAVVGTVFPGNMITASAIRSGTNRNGQKLAMHKINTLLFQDKFLDKQSGTYELVSTTTRKFGGIVTAVKGDNFVITGFSIPFQNSLDRPSSIASTSYAVAMSDSTVFMKDGKLDSDIEIRVDDRVLVIGTLDENNKSVTAMGVSIITNPRQGIRN